MSPIKAVWLWIRWRIWEPTFSNQQLIPSKKGGSIALIEFHSSCQSYHHPICWEKAKNSTLDREMKILKMANSVGNRSFHWKTSDPNLFWVEKISVHVHSNSSSIETMLRQSSAFSAVSSAATVSQMSYLVQKWVGQQVNWDSNIPSRPTCPNMIRMVWYEEHHTTIYILNDHHIWIGTHEVGRWDGQNPSMLSSYVMIKIMLNTKLSNDDHRVI